MRKLSEIEDRFVRDVLDKHGEYIEDLLADSIERKKLKISERLIDSLRYKVEKRGSDYVLQIYFVSYGRAIEIQWFKSRQLRRESKAAGNESYLLRRAQRKDTRFYSKNVYGSINRLLGRMSSEYTDAEIERIKGILENVAKNSHKYIGYTSI